MAEPPATWVPRPAARRATVYFWPQYCIDTTPCRLGRLGIGLVHGRGRAGGGGTPTQNAGGASRLSTTRPTRLVRVFVGRARCRRLRRPIRRRRHRPVTAPHTQFSPAARQSSGQTQTGPGGRGWRLGKKRKRWGPHKRREGVTAATNECRVPSPPAAAPAPAPTIDPAHGIGGQNDDHRRQKARQPPPPTHSNSRASLYVMAPWRGAAAKGSSWPSVGLAMTMEGSDCSGGMVWM